MHYRTYYLFQDRAIGMRSEAWAMGGSLSYRSGWLEDVFRAEVEGFTSQPIIAPDRRGGTLLLDTQQNGHTVLGIANGQLRYGGLLLTGGRKYLDLPYVNRQDNRMTPNTFEGISLEKPEGKVRFSAGYVWRIKGRDADDFESFTSFIGIEDDRGLAHVGAVADIGENLSLGTIAAVVPDLFAGLYGEVGYKGPVLRGWDSRLDFQWSYQDSIGDDLGEKAGIPIDETFNIGIRASASRAGAVLRIGGSFTGDASIEGFYGSNPSYTNLMQRTFTAGDEKALLLSASYDFSEVGLPALSVIVNFVAAFDGERFGLSGQSQTLDATIDYRIGSGILETFWLRLRGSWLHDQNANKDGKDFRVILRYDIPVIR